MLISLFGEGAWLFFAGLSIGLGVALVVFVNARVRLAQRPDDNDSSPDPQLQLSEKDYRDIVDHGDRAILVLDAHVLHILDANQRAFEVYEYPREQLIGADFARLNSDPVTVRKAVLDRLDGHTSEAIVTQQLRSDGTAFPAQMDTVRLWYKRRRAILIAARDITLQQQPEGAVKEREERFRLLLEGVTDYAIVMLDPFGRVVSWNEGAQRLSGYQEREIVGKPVSLFFPPEEGETLTDLLSRAVVMGRLEFEAMRLRKDGSRFNASITMTTIMEESGTVRGFAVVIRDITARVELDRARQEVFDIVRAKANEWTATFDAVHVPIVLLDDQGTIRRLNRAAQSLAGVPFAELIRKPVREVPGEPWRTIAVACRETFDRGSVGNLPAVQGDRVWQISSSIAGTSTGERRAIVVAYDLTIVNKLESALRQTEVAAALGTMVAGVAHEVRNPLFTISATLDAWQARYGSGEGMARYSGTLREQVSRLTLLMGDLLEYGKPHALTLARVSMSDVIHAAAADCASLAAEHEVDILLDLDVALPDVEADAAGLEQVFQNIIDNAIRYSPRRSPVLVECSGDGEGVIIRITDSGSGASDDDLERAFIPFYSKRPGGTGLGLPIARRIIGAHHGEVSLQRREDGPGVVAVIHIPKRQPLAADAFAKTERLR